MKPTRSDHLSDEALARRGLSRETDIVLTADGRWLAGGAPIEHPGVAAAFARWIERAPTGRYVLRNGLHYVYLRVEGAPLHAEDVVTEPGGALALLLQGGVREPLRPKTLREGPDGALYANARDGTWPVRLSPRAALALAPFLEEDADGRPALRAGGALHRIPRRADPLRPDA